MKTDPSGLLTAEPRHNEEQSQVIPGDAVSGTHFSFLQYPLRTCLYRFKP